MKEITVEEALIWTASLRSGKYKQGKYYLESGNNEFCCLGVACKVFIPEDKINKNNKGVIKGAYPSCTNQPHAPLWLMNINHDFFHKTSEYLLSTFNDRFDYSFDEIADLIEMLYVHKILD